MWKRVTLPLEGIFLNLMLMWTLFALLMTYAVDCLSATAVLLDSDPVEVREVFYNSYHDVQKRKLPKVYVHAPDTEYFHDQEPSFSDKDSFFMEPDDAVVGNKYSPPVVEHYPVLRRRYRGNFASPISGPQNSPDDRHFKSAVKVPAVINNQNIPPTRDSVVVDEVFVTSGYKVDGDGKIPQGDYAINDRKHRRSETAVKPHILQNNFTDVKDSQVLLPSNAVSQYKPHAVVLPKNDTPKNLSDEQVENILYDVPNTTHDILIPNNTLVPSVNSVTIRDDLRGMSINERTRSTVDLFDKNVSTEKTIYIVENQTVSTTEPSESLGNISNLLPSAESSRRYKLSSGTVVGIVIGILTCVTLLTSSVIYLLYRRYNGKCSGVVEGKFNSDNCGYLDDSLRSSVYLNNHIELPKENSEEMTSLDNDSFLNSLETMTIQNYWADNTKNTKV